MTRPKTAIVWPGWNDSAPDGFWSWMLPNGASTLIVIVAWLFASFTSTTVLFASILTIRSWLPRIWRPTDAWTVLWSWPGAIVRLYRAPSHDPGATESQMATTTLVAVVWPVLSRVTFRSNAAPLNGLGGVPRGAMLRSGCVRTSNGVSA